MTPINCYIFPNTLCSMIILEYYQGLASRLVVCILKICFKISIVIFNIYNKTVIGKNIKQVA